MKATRLLGQLIRLLLFSLLLALLIALAWTALQIASVADGGAAPAGTTVARRAAYRATATAIHADDDEASLEYNPGIVLMQEIVTAGTPASAGADEPTAALVATAVPDDFQLPKLLIPRDPEEGKWMSGLEAPRRVAPVIRRHRLVNIMLLGSDEELTEDNFIRTDTMIVVSLNVETGTVSMMSLPRDLYVYIPHGKMGRLNTAFGIGENLSWDPGRGFGLLRQTIFYNLGINVHYYARVNFSGFETVIDRLGGVDIAVDCAYRDLYPIWNGEYRWRTLPVGLHSFDGFDALWYARTRKYTDDFDRGRRQQLLLRAMWRKARSEGLVATIPRLWSEMTDVVDTDLPLDMLLRLLPHLVNLDLADVENITFRKNYHTTEWITPGGAEVQLPNEEPIAALMQDFYTPPSPYQVSIAGPTIGVYNASDQDNWDIVATERLRWDGYNAVALGKLDDGAGLASSQLTDHVATEKGSLVPRILRALNMTEEQAEQDARADRDYDYVVRLGRDYESCTYAVLPLDR